MSHCRPCVLHICPTIGPYVLHNRHTVEPYVLHKRHIVVAHGLTQLSSHHSLQNRREPKAPLHNRPTVSPYVVHNRHTVDPYALFKRHTVVAHGLTQLSSHLSSQDRREPTASPKNPRELRELRELRQQNNSFSLHPLGFHDDGLEHTRTRRRKREFALLEELPLREREHPRHPIRSDLSTSPVTCNKRKKLEASCEYSENSPRVGGANLPSLIRTRKTRIDKGIARGPAYARRTGGHVHKTPKKKGVVHVPMTKWQLLRKLPYVRGPYKMKNAVAGGAVADGSNAPAAVGLQVSLTHLSRMRQPSHPKRYTFVTHL
jgi:hypothetical protein